MKCGPGGDIYAVYSGSAKPLELGNAPIRRISAASQTVTEYAFPAISGYEKLGRLSFDVSANGTLYALLLATVQSESKNDSEPVYAYLIVKYKDDGRLDSYYKLGEIPGKHLHPTSFAVFADGSSLVSGMTLEQTADGTLRNVFSAVFDQNGTFRTPVTVMKLDAPAQGQEHPPDPTSLAGSLHSLSSPDGNLYLFRQDGHLEVLSPGGSVEHVFKLPPPSDGLTGLQMAAAGPGFLFVFYDHLATGEPVEESRYRGMISVVYPQTGEVTSLYRMPQNGFSTPACAASPKDFLVLSTDDNGFLEVVHYGPG